MPENSALKEVEPTFSAIFQKKYFAKYFF